MRNSGPKAAMLLGALALAAASVTGYGHFSTVSV